MWHLQGSQLTYSKVFCETVRCNDMSQKVVLNAAQVKLWHEHPRSLSQLQDVLMIWTLRVKLWYKRYVFEGSHNSRTHWWLEQNKSSLNRQSSKAQSMKYTQMIQTLRVKFWNKFSPGLSQFEIALTTWPQHKSSYEMSVVETSNFQGSFTTWTLHESNFEKNALESLTKQERKHDLNTASQGLN